MIFIPAVNLFFYNALIVYLAKDVKRIVEVPNEYVSFWASLPVIGWMLAPKQYEMLKKKEYNEFSDNLLIANLVINLFILLPAFKQHCNLSIVVALDILWNFFVFQRSFIFWLNLIWSLWWSELSSFYFILLVISGVFLCGIHIMLILDVMSLHATCIDSMAKPVPNENNDTSNDVDVDEAVDVAIDVDVDAVDDA